LKEAWLLLGPSKEKRRGKMKTALAAGLLFFIFDVCPATAQTSEFDSCGQLFSDGIECLGLFRADDGKYYRIQNTDGFSPPDRVHVVGTLVQGPACVGVPCAVPIEGCIENNTIAQCLDGFDTDSSATASIWKIPSQESFAVNNLQSHWMTSSSRNQA
jgi:hypothetical protein